MQHAAAWRQPPQTPKLLDNPLLCCTDIPSRSTDRKLKPRRNTKQEETTILANKEKVATWEVRVVSNPFEKWKSEYIHPPQSGHVATSELKLLPHIPS
jgi:hypothetical protein